MSNYPGEVVAAPEGDSLSGWIFSSTGGEFLFDLLEFFGSFSDGGFTGSMTGGSALRGLLLF